MLAQRPIRATGGAAAGVGLLLLGCDVSFPDEYRVEDLRVLNLRADPPEVAAFARIPGAPLPLDTIQVRDLLETPVDMSALVAHPDLDAEIEIRWLRCGALDDLPCNNRVDLGVVGPEVEVVPAKQLLEAFSEVGRGSTSGPGSIGEVASSSAAFAIGSLVEDPRDLFNGFFAYVNTSIRVETASIAVDTMELDAEKRIILYDPRLIATAIREAGSRGPSSAGAALGLPNLCSTATDGQREELFKFLETRKPNGSPILAPVLVEITEGITDTPTRAIGRGEHVAPIELGRGETISMRPDIAFGSKETYSVIDGNCRLTEFEEKMVFSWFTVHGTLTRHTSTDRAPVVEYTAPDDSGILRDRVWLVLRDGRGGSDHLSFDVTFRN